MFGPQVYNTACLAGYDASIGGAPVLGDAAQWAERIAQGADSTARYQPKGRGFGMAGRVLCGSNRVSWDYGEIN